MSEKRIPAPHPGKILFEEFLEAMGISQYRLAKSINVQPRRINEIVHGKRAITSDTAIRLGLFFGIPPQFWSGLQMDYDLALAEEELEDRLKQEVQPYAA